jgi:hypothetical protein
MAGGEKVPLLKKLNQAVAIEKNVKAKADRELTDLHRVVQQPDRLSGISRVYQPREDLGEQLPPQSTRVQIVVGDINKLVAKTLTHLFNVVATKDIANTKAEGRVVVGGEILFTAPVPFLLFLEKQLIRVRTYVDKLPTLDPAFNWTLDPTSGVYRTDEVVTTRTRKTPHNHVLYPATPEHPAQVQTYNVDEVVGDWTTYHFSGAITEERRLELLERVDMLAIAVKFAREEANGTSIEDDSTIGDTVFEYLFA